MIVVMIDKINGYQILETNQYHIWVQNHLKKNAEEIPRRGVVDLHQRAEKYAEKLAEKLSKGKNAFS